MQTISSANTSINRRLPRLYGQLPNDVRNCQMLDYGCGKYPEYVKKWGEERGIAVTSYDKYNYPSEDWFKPYGYDVVTCSNVLNVIQDYSVRRDLLIDCYECLRIGGKLYITVYEGDRTGRGKTTKSDCWQENRKLSDYLDEVRRIFKTINVSIKNNMIVARKER